jgi:hypothetical protein
MKSASQVAHTGPPTGAFGATLPRKRGRDDRAGT